MKKRGIWITISFFKIVLSFDTDNTGQPLTKKQVLNNMYFFDLRKKLNNR